MRIEETVLWSFTNEIAQRLCRQVIRSLRKMPATLSGADTSLKNVWEEICVQVQGDESFHWGLYRMTVNADVARSIDNLKKHERLALWLLTEQGIDWCCDHGDDINCAERAPVCIDDIAEYLWQEHVCEEAGRYENARIRRFLDSDSEYYGEEEMY